MNALGRVAGPVVFALLLASAPSAATADEGTDADDPVVADDPGIASLHDAIAAWKDARVALKDECRDNGTADCRAKAKALRTSFKTARSAAIAEHRAFRQEQRAAREDAKVKDATRLTGRDRASAAREAAKAAKAARDAAKGDRKTKVTSDSDSD